MKMARYLLACSLLVPSVVLADQPADEYRINTQPRAVTSEVNRASDASFDKRLPPVLPGEEVNDSGKKMRVWSTSGGVPVSAAPEPWRDTGKLPEGVGVIVDSRSRGGKRDERPAHANQGAVGVTEGSEKR